MDGIYLYLYIFVYFQVFLTFITKKNVSFLKGQKKYWLELKENIK